MCSIPFVHVQNHQPTLQGTPATLYKCAIGKPNQAIQVPCSQFVVMID